MTERMEQLFEQIDNKDKIDYKGINKFKSDVHDFVQ